MRPIVLDDNTVYLMEQKWRCGKSSTGAHKWMLGVTDGHCSECGALYSEVYGKINGIVDSAWALYFNSEQLDTDYQQFLNWSGGV